VRRSFAALLRASLGLHAQPRNPAKPNHFDRFGLNPADDAELRKWVRENLRIAVWPSRGEPDPLGDVERQVLKTWNPPLNLTHIHATHLTAVVKTARAAMADEARDSV
jgi:hypothetical protein